MPANYDGKKTIASSVTSQEFVRHPEDALGARQVLRAQRESAWTDFYERGPGAHRQIGELPVAATLADEADD